MKYLLYPAILGAALSLAALPTAGADEETLDLADFPGTVVDDVVVPVASEVFSVLDKLGEPDWAGQLRKLEAPRTTDRTRLALLLGSVVAEGFIAVQAQDREKVEDIGREVLRLADSLAIRDAVIKNTQVILDSAREGDWATIKRELDRTQKTVRETMETMRDDELAQCVSIGGWLRGTEALTSLIGKAYDVDKAELLNQPFLVDHFSKRIKSMSAEVRDHGTVKSVADGLEKIRLQMGAGDGVPDVDVVTEVNAICARLIREITDGKS